MPHTEQWEISIDCATPEEAIQEHGLGEFSSSLADFGVEDIGPEGLMKLHQQFRQDALARADRAFGLVLVWLLASTNLDHVARQGVRETDEKRWVNKGLKDISVTMPSGVEVPLTVTYLLHKERRRAGRAKNHGNRGEQGSGCYPALEALGFDSHRRLSPLIEEVILYSGTVCDDFRTGFEMAELFGYQMSWKAYWSRFQRLAGQVRNHHDQWLFTEEGSSLIDADRWDQQRVVIAVDGGRTRLRENKQGRPKKNGWRNFDAEWREPKLFAIYAIDDDGEPLREIEPIIDGTFGDADAFFERLEATLTHLGIDRAAEVAFLGDGARWIWKRARPLLERLGVDEECSVEGIDFYHAFSALCKLSELPNWPDPAKTRWRLRARKALKAGDIEQLGKMIDGLSKSSGAEDAADKKDHFTNNAKRMQFELRRQQNLPEGSGAIESAIRRVVNLRMKGNGKFWKEENAEAMLTVRSHLKSGRFHRLMTWWRRRRTRWWTTADRQRMRTSSSRSWPQTGVRKDRKVA